MQLVIADTGPVNYLVLIEQIDLLPALFQKVILPTARPRFGRILPKGVADMKSNVGATQRRLR